MPEKAKAYEFYAINGHPCHALKYNNKDQGWTAQDWAQPTQDPAKIVGTWSWNL